MFFELVKKYNFKRELPYALAVAVSLLIVYAIAMPSTVTLEDSGEFLTAAYSLGTVHPPGYPLYILLAHVFSHVFPGNPALGIHLLSALTGSLACLFLYYCVLYVGGRRLGALLAAFCYGFSNTFWWQSMVAEVYSLHAMLFFILFFLLIKMSLPNGFSEKQLYLFCFVLGLSLCNHWPLLFLCLPAFFLMLLRIDLFRERIKKPGSLIMISKSLLCFALALLPYLHVPISSYYEPAASFAKIENFSDFWEYVSRGGYSQYDNNPEGTLSQKWKYIYFFFTRLIDEFYWPGLVLIFAGFLLSWKSKYKNFALPLLLCFISSSILIHLFMSKKFDMQGKELFQVYLLVPFGIAAFYIGIVFCHERLYKGLTRPSLLLLPALLLVGSVFLSNYKENDMRTESFAQSIANAILRSLPPNANLFVDSDVYTAPLMYMNLAAKLRPDVTLYNQYGRLLGNRILYAKKMSFRKALDTLYDLVSAKQPFYALTTSRKQLLRRLEQDPRLRVSYQGIVHQYLPKDQNKEDKEEFPVQTNFANEIRNFLDELDKGKHAGNRWHIMRGGVTQHFCLLLAQEQKVRDIGTAQGGTAKNDTVYRREQKVRVGDAMAAHPYCAKWFTKLRRPKP